ncbi:IS3 family transposase [Streptomyces sp. NPDC058683]|uniref:IS3 family transposase n=1 Tax=Streptomyces sp. NPDC058683 TaxID=3346597 RepID=UPI00365DC8A4
MTVHPFIEAEKQSGHNVRRACELLKVSRTAFYVRRAGKPGPRAVRDAELTEQITEVHARSRGTYGAPRVHAVLKREGAGCGRRRVARLMRAAGLQGRHHRRRHLTTIPDPRAASRPDLIVRDFQPDPAGLDARWCGDITYIPTEEGWLYLATVIDIASRRVVGWATADHLRTELVADALKTACRQRRPARPVIFHSDRGCQGGFNQSSQHLICMGVLDGASSAGSGSGGASEAEVSGASEVSASCRGGVLGGDRQGPSRRGGRRRHRRGAGGRGALVPRVWRHAAVRFEATLGQVLVVLRARGDRVAAGPGQGRARDRPGRRS